MASCTYSRPFLEEKNVVSSVPAKFLFWMDNALPEAVMVVCVSYSSGPIEVVKEKIGGVLTLLHEDQEQQ